MGQKEKLIAKLKSNPKTFTFDEAESLLGYLFYFRGNAARQIMLFVMSWRGPTGNLRRSGQHARSELDKAVNRQ